MGEIHGHSEVQETKKPDVENFKQVSPELKEKFENAKSFIKDIFVKSQDTEVNIEKELKDYFKDLRNKSDCPETLDERPFDFSDIKRVTPEVNAEMRSEFNERKQQLKSAWEKENNMAWPKYDHDIYSDSGKLIRRKGDDYDAHHIQPLGWGGKNEASNITPLSAEVHYDKQGVHSPDSPYSKIDKMIGAG